MYRSILTAAGCAALLAVPILLGAATLGKTDMQFMKMAAEADMTGAHLGQMAESQATQADVKGFGQTLDKDNTHAYQGLEALAGKTGETIPKGIDIRKNKGVAQLEHMKGKTFDQAFLREEIQSDQKVIAEFKNEAQHGSNADVKAWATSMLPTLQTHVQTAQNLEKQLQKK
jgi:putative membrane protein